MNGITNNKVGIKLLNERQLDAALSGRKILEKKIYDVRQRAKDWHESRMSYTNSSEYLHYNLMFDNLFSIVGERGTGKTSVLFTIYNEILNKNKQYACDIVLPMIIPELMHDRDSLIRWILEAMAPVIRAIEQDITNNRKEFEPNHALYKDYFEDCVFNKHNKLNKLYAELKQEYMTIQSNANNSRYTYTENIRIEQDIIANSYGFLESLRKLWDYIIYVRRQINLHVKDITDEPLIYVFIDDIDLAPKLVNEILYMMPKYLSHENLIVVVSLSPSIMKIAVEHSLYRDITGNSLAMFSYPIRGKTLVPGIGEIFDEDEVTEFHLRQLDYTQATRAYKCISRLANDILLKIFAPSNRFYIRDYISLEQKGNFLYAAIASEYGNINIKNLSDVYEICINKLLMMLPKTVADEKRKNIKTSTMYLSFLGSTAREISNVCIAMYDMIETLQELKPEYDDGVNIDIIYNALTGFMKVIVDSKPEFRCLISRMHKLLMKQYNGWKLYVNYQELNNIFCHEDHILINRKERLNTFISMYAMLNFVEQIIYILQSNRQKTHGYEQFFELIFDICGCEHIIPQENDLSKSFKRLEAFYDKDIIQKYNVNEITHQDAFLRSVFNIGYNDLEEIKIDKCECQKVISDYITKDIDAGEVLCKVLYRRFSGIWLFSHLSRHDFTLITNNVTDKDIVTANDLLKDNISYMITGSADYITDLKYRGQDTQYTLSDDENKNSIKEKEKLYRSITLECKKKALINDNLIKMSDISTSIQNLGSNLKDWVLQNVQSGEKNSNKFMKLRDSIYEYNDVRQNDRLVMIKDNQYFDKILSEMTGKNARLDDLIMELRKQRRASSLEYNEMLEKKIEQQYIIIEESNTIKQSETRRRVINRYNNKMNSLISLRDMESFIEDAKRIINRMVYEGVGNYPSLISKLDELASSVEIVFYYNEDTIHDAIEYLLNIKALVHIHEKYIYELLSGIEKNDSIHLNHWNKIPVRDVYQQMASKSTTFNECRQLFMRHITNEQNETVRKLLNR